MTTCSIPSGKSKIQRTSENAAARISIPIETLGATDFAAKPIAKCPTNTRAPQYNFLGLPVTYYSNSPPKLGGGPSEARRGGSSRENLESLRPPEPPRLRLSKVASQHLFDGAATPPNLGGDLCTFHPAHRMLQAMNLTALIAVVLFVQAPQAPQPPGTASLAGIV